MLKAEIKANINKIEEIKKSDLKLEHKLLKRKEENGKLGTHCSVEMITKFLKVIFKRNIFKLFSQMSDSKRAFNGR